MLPFTGTPLGPVMLAAWGPFFSMYYIKFHSFSISYAAETFPGVILLDSSLTDKHIFLGIISGDEPLFVFHIEPLQCPQNFRGNDLFTFASEFVSMAVLLDVLVLARLSLAAALLLLWRVGGGGRGGLPPPPSPAAQARGQNSCHAGGAALWRSRRGCRCCCRCCRGRDRDRRGAAARCRCCCELRATSEAIPLFPAPVSPFGLEPWSRRGCRGSPQGG